ncbi:DUF5996 family protein [Chelativorans sp. Marseille-P2723]|uniref:DUF5996 family protein n=1 Tax=Chelativorans sp. Marseille-P2723 TaxID=2709133 RepID=UPI0015715285|nr:DUF5996 family protein [Chelativorans sp. Marseille-P2723]
MDWDLPDSVFREAYSPEVSSSGFGHGSFGMDDVMFYFYPSTASKALPDEVWFDDSSR